MEDQPILDQAQALANLKDYSTAIETANQIPPGRALSGEASQNIRRWRRELRAGQNLQQANQLAATGTAEGLTRAIALVTNISTKTDAGVQRSELLERWSYQLLSFAWLNPYPRKVPLTVRLAPKCKAGAIFSNLRPHRQ
jgi:hypothetical protein